MVDSITYQMVFDAVLRDNFTKQMDGIGKIIDQTKNKILEMSKTSTINIAQVETVADGFNRSLQKMNTTFGETTSGYQQASIAGDEVMRSQQRAAEFSKQFKQSLDNGASSMHNFTSRMNLAGIAMRKLTMQFLGVMFFGMMMQRMFLGLLRPAMEAFGVFDLWNVMLLTTFIPVMEELMPLFISFVEWIIELDDSTQLVIGALVVFGVILGTILMVFGQVALGVGALIALLPQLSTLFAGFGAIISAPFLAIAAFILLILGGIYLAWEENFGGIRDYMELFIQGIKNIFNGLKTYFKGVMKIVTSIFKGDWEGVVEGLELMWDGFVTFFQGIGETLIGLVGTIVLGYFRLWKGLLTTIKDAFKALLRTLDDWTGGYITRTKAQLILLMKLFEKFLRFTNQPVLAAGVATVRKAVEAFSFEKTQFTDPVELGQGGVFTGFQQSMAPGTTDITYAPVTYVTVSDKQEFERMIDDASKKTIDELNRLVATANTTGGS